MNNIQTGDIIKTFSEHHNEYRQMQILHCKQAPTDVWVVKDVLDGKKFRLHTQGQFSKTFSHTS